MTGYLNIWRVMYIVQQKTRFCTHEYGAGGHGSLVWSCVMFKSSSCQGWGHIPQGWFDHIPRPTACSACK
jgi:hypothetical protein